MLNGLAMTALGCAGVFIPVLSDVKRERPSLVEIEAIADARLP